MASEKITALVEEIKGLTILELADLVKAVEEEFGVSAAAPVAVAGAGAAAAAPAAEEKTEFDVVLTSFGSEKLTENMDTLVKAVVKAKPSAAKGQYIRSCTVASTMGPGVKVSTAKF